MAWFTGRRSRDPRVDLVAELVRTYYRIYGRPVRGAAKIAALLAALSYLNPETGAPRSKPLQLGISLYFDPASGIIKSGEVNDLLEEAAEEGLVRITSDVCYESVIDACDSPPYTYVYTPGRKKPRISNRRLAKLVELTVRRYGGMDVRELAKLILNALGAPRTLLHTLTHPVPLEQLAA